MTASQPRKYLQTKLFCKHWCSNGFPIYLYILSEISSEMIPTETLCLIEMCTQFKIRSSIGLVSCRYEDRESGGSIKSINNTTYSSSSKRKEKKIFSFFLTFFFLLQATVPTGSMPETLPLFLIKKSLKFCVKERWMRTEYKVMGFVMDERLLDCRKCL